ncbi:hypothetical protein EYF80_011594 [Liparis tanakae]|uniref:Uncharacterized protein n=1 Tax=Liparis tanakae TaxID=230148 RepID=A0A4Z2IJC9_9TELE|nr:hypothetical protein EYF80_011594 [Liparis tanakae]
MWLIALNTAKEYSSDQVSFCGEKGKLSAKTPSATKERAPTVVTSTSPPHHTADAKYGDQILHNGKAKSQGSKMMSELSSMMIPVRKLSTRSMRKKVSETTLKMIQGVVVSSLKKVMPTGMMIRLPTINSSIVKSQ